MVARAAAYERRSARAADAGHGRSWRADGQQQGSDLGCEREVTVTLHGRHEGRNERLEPLAADPVGGLPQHDQPLANSLIVEPSERPRCRPPIGRTGPKQAHGVLAVKTRHGRELVDDPGLLRSCATLVARRESCQ